jgi:hypothetical protein
MMLFPQGPIAIGRMAEAHLIEVVRRPRDVVARYALTPRDTNEYVDKLGGLRAWLGRRYEPVPGTWTSFVVPEERDEIELVVGLDRGWGQALVRAHETLRYGGANVSVVPDLTVRSLALGYLARAGA